MGIIKRYKTKEINLIKLLIYLSTINNKNINNYGRNNKQRNGK